MSGGPGVLGLVAAGAGGVEKRFRLELAEPAARRGWRLAITLTPTAYRWLDAAGELPQLRALTDLPVRAEPRLPSEPKPHPVPDCFLFAPATMNSVVKLALGLPENQALAAVAEAMGMPRVPVVVHPQCGEPLSRHPAWPGHLATLAGAGVRLAGEEHAADWTGLLDLVDDAVRQIRPNG
ncbi:flavoprotein [Solihabitans fulvus]|uniref:Flavoprotein n=1 Tax=Solihabitans fulvus TaxID=1892852 RepID=A0A5B2XDP1_9PSEU|nr:flavoprotein [Solihabitans fulvus]KAA2261807.1 flavoprotein [Solihabitans fulvus]